MAAVRSPLRFSASLRHCTPGLHERVAFMLAAWRRMLFRMKVERNATALDRFRPMLASLLDLTSQP